MSKYGLIYIVSNSEQKKNLFKIGKTSRSIEERIKELNSATGTLGKFVPHATFLVKDIDEMEKYIHKKLSKIRYQKNREFFEANYTELLLKVEQLISAECLKRDVITIPDKKIVKKLNEKKIQLEKEFLTDDIDMDNLLEDSINENKSILENKEKDKKEEIKTNEKFVNYQLQTFNKNLNKLIKSLSKHKYIQFYITDKPPGYEHILRCLVVIGPDDEKENFESIKHHSKFFTPFKSDIAAFKIEFIYYRGGIRIGKLTPHYRIGDTYNSTHNLGEIFNLGKFFKFLILDMGKLISNYKLIYQDSDDYKINHRKKYIVDNSLGDFDEPYEGDDDLGLEPEDEDKSRFSFDDCDYSHALDMFKKHGE